MKKGRLFKKLTALTLTLIMAASAMGVSLTAVLAAPAQSESVSIGSSLVSFGLNKLYTTGLMAAGKGLSALADYSNSEEFQQVASILDTWVFGNGQANAIAEVNELCEEILAEVQEINENLTASASKIEGMLGQQDYRELYDKLDAAWEKYVELTGNDYSQSVNDALSSYFSYMEAAQVYANAREAGGDTFSAAADYSTAENELIKNFIDIYNEKIPRPQTVNS